MGVVNHRVPLGRKGRSPPTVDADPAGPTRTPLLTTTQSTATSQEQDCRPDNACSGATSSNKVRSPSPNRTGVNGGWGPNPLATGWRPRQAQVSGGREPSAVTARGPSGRLGKNQRIKAGPNSSMCSHPSQGYTTLHYPGPARPLTQTTIFRRIGHRETTLQVD